MDVLEIRGHWYILKGNLIQEYAKVDMDELRYIDGMIVYLQGRVYQKLGKIKGMLIKALNRLRFFLK